MFTVNFDDVIGIKKISDKSFSDLKEIYIASVSTVTLLP